MTEINTFKPEGIIFDLDGTLADTLPLCIVSFQEALKEATGKEYSREDVVAHLGKSEEGIINSLTSTKQEECLKVFLDIYKKNHDICPSLFEGMTDILDLIHNNSIKMAMVTGKGKSTAKITLEYYNIDKYFEFVETGAQIGSIKPECIAKIAKAWDMPTEQIAYIGDSPNDIRDSYEAGVKPIAVTWASTTKADTLKQLKPFILFEKITDFKNWLVQMTK